MTEKIGNDVRQIARKYFKILLFRNAFYSTPYCIPLDFSVICRSNFLLLRLSDRQAYLEKYSLLTSLVLDDHNTIPNQHLPRPNLCVLHIYYFSLLFRKKWYGTEYFEIG